MNNKEKGIFRGASPLQNLSSPSPLKGEGDQGGEVEQITSTGVPIWQRI